MVVLEINGSLELSIKDLNGNFVSESEKKEIVDKINKSEYLLGLSSRTITNFKFEVLYNFEFDVLDDTEYNMCYDE